MGDIADAVREAVRESLSEMKEELRDKLKQDLMKDIEERLQGDVGSLRTLLHSLQKRVEEIERLIRDMEPPRSEGHEALEEEVKRLRSLRKMLGVNR